MKKLCLSLMVVTMILFASWFTVQAEAVDLSQTYTNEAEGFSLKFPSDWSLMEAKDIPELREAGGLVMIATQDRSGFFVNLTVAKGVDDGYSHLTRNEYLELLEPDYDSIFIVDVADVSISEVRGRYFEAGVVLEGHNFALRQYMYVIDNDLYVITCYSSLAEYDIYALIFDAIMDNYTVTNASTSQTNAQAGTRSQSPDYDLSRTYTNATEGFSFNFPGIWEIGNLSEEEVYFIPEANVGLTLITYLLSPTTSGAMAPVMNIRKAPVTQEVIDTIFSSTLANIMPEGNMMATNIEDLTIDGFPSRKVTFSAKVNEETEFIVVRYVYFIGSSQYRVEFLSSPTSMEFMETVINDVMDSYAITRTASSSNDNASPVIPPQVVNLFDEDFFQLCASGTAQEVETAINEGADVNARDEYGETPLMSAARSNRNPEVISILLQNGADASIRDNEGITAVDYAAVNARLRNTDAYQQLVAASNAAINEGISPNQTSSNEADVLQIYIDYVNEVRKNEDWSDEYGEMSLIYIDDDDIPELVIDWASTAGGAQVCTISNGKLVYTYVETGGVSYIERQNIFVSSGGRMGHYYETVYTIQNGEFTVLHRGEHGEEETDDEEMPFYFYWHWDGEEVTHSKYSENLKSAFDRSKAINSSDNAFSAADMLQKINELLRSNSSQSTRSDAPSMSDEDFINFCESATLQEIEEAIKNGANVNARSMNTLGVSRATRDTPLMRAARRNSNPEVISILVKNGADVNARNVNGDTPLMWALSAHFDFGCNPEMIAVLLENGADPSIKNNNGMTAIDYASEFLMNTEVYEIVLAASNAAITETNNSALDTSEQVMEPTAMSDEDFFALCRSGTAQEIEAVIKSGVEPNTRLEDGTTALIRAASSNPNPEVISFLLENGADVNARNNFGWTALMTAARNNRNPEVVSILLRNGADASISNDNEMTAVDYASENESLRNSSVYQQLVAASNIYNEPIQAKDQGKINIEKVDWLVSNGHVPQYVQEAGSFHYNPNYFKVIIIGNNVRLRSQPNMEARIIDNVTNGEILTYHGEWTHPQGEKWLIAGYDTAATETFVWIHSDFSELLTQEQYAEREKISEITAERVTPTESYDIEKIVGWIGSDLNSVYREIGTPNSEDSLESMTLAFYDGMVIFHDSGSRPPGVYSIDGKDLSLFTKDGVTLDNKTRAELIQIFGTPVEEEFSEYHNIHVIVFKINEYIGLAFHMFDPNDTAHELLLSTGWDFSDSDASYADTQWESVPQTSADFDLMSARVTGNNVNVRSAPNTQGRVLFQITNPDDEFLVIYKNPTRDSSGENWYRIIFRWGAEFGEFIGVDGEAYIISRFLAIEPLSAQLIEEYGLDYYWDEIKKDILNPQQTQQYQLSAAQSVRPSGVYADFLKLNVLHFRGDILEAYQVGMPVGRWSVKVEGNVLVLTPMMDNVREGRWQFRNEGEVLHTQIDTPNPGIWYRQVPGTTQTIIGYI